MFLGQYRNSFDDKVVMREVSGQDLARRVQKVRPDIKVMFMSGYTDSAIVHQGVLDPEIAFLAKPFPPCSPFSALS